MLKKSFVFFFIAGCGLFTKSNIKTALDAVQLACVFESAITDSDALAKVCDIAEDSVPLVRKLVQQRQAAQKSGVSWSAPDGGITDGGADGK